MLPPLWCKFRSLNGPTGNAIVFSTVLPSQCARFHNFPVCVRGVMGFQVCGKKGPILAHGTVGTEEGLYQYPSGGTEPKFLGFGTEL